MHPWLEHLDRDFYVKKGVTDAYPWPDFLDKEHFSKHTGRTYFKELYPP